MNVQIEESWKAHLQPEFDKDYFYKLTNFVREEYGKNTIYPPGTLIFNALTNNHFKVLVNQIESFLGQRTKLFHLFFEDISIQ